MLVVEVEEHQVHTQEHQAAAAAVALAEQDLMVILEI
jgi:hypothetical protein